MKRNREIQLQNRIKFFEKIKREEVDEIDDITFNTWKSELKRELPIFWDSILNKWLITIYFNNSHLTNLHYQILNIEESIY